ncbi:YcxB family protein [Mucilaginibacter sp.]|uniref:YcxB family protein n=1 Tax=Mucilaginibacter sp. TaxID=1882438 RepID=UPI00260C2A19|nr:YcxB family protein [Mucilaginibacter sp.]MDB5030374.1 hypothetical protein [Mucilaginibacter sp.]
MQIKTQIQFKDYLKLQYTLSYQSFFTLFSTCLVVIAFIVSFRQILEGAADDDTIYWLIFLGAYIFLRPVVTYFATKKNFNTHQILREEIIYEFLPDKLLVTTSYSNSEIPWTKMYKIRELKKWFLIYQSNRTANLISKNFLTDEQILQLRSLFKSIQGIKLKLKSK